MLRIEKLSLSRKESKERSIEHFDIFDNGRCPDEVRIIEDGLIHAALFQFLARKKRDQFLSVAEMVPELIETSRFRISPGHADDSDLRAIVRLSHWQSSINQAGPFGGLSPVSSSRLSSFAAALALVEISLFVLIFREQLCETADRCAFEDHCGRYLDIEFLA